MAEAQSVLLMTLLFICQIQIELIKCCGWQRTNLGTNQGKVCQTNQLDNAIIVKL